MSVLLLLATLEPSLAFCAPSPAARPALPSAARLRGGSASASLQDYHGAAASIFNHMRTPAALVAGACLPLGFAFAFPDKEDKPKLRSLKRLNVLLAFLSVNSELLSVIFATNAINRLYFLDTNTLTTHSVMVRMPASSLPETPTAIGPQRFPPSVSGIVEARVAVAVLARRVHSKVWIRLRKRHPRGSG